MRVCGEPEDISSALGGTVDSKKLLIEQILPYLTALQCTPCGMTQQRVNDTMIQHCMQQLSTPSTWTVSAAQPH
jgi:hypothetical protein